MCIHYRCENNACVSVALQVHACIIIIVSLLFFNFLPVNLFLFLYNETRKTSYVHMILYYFYDVNIIKFLKHISTEETNRTCVRK